MAHSWVALAGERLLTEVPEVGPVYVCVEVASFR